MPSKQTIIDDLHFNRAQGIGRVCKNPNQNSILSDDLHIKNSVVPMKVSFGGVPGCRLNMDETDLNQADGFCLFNRDKWSTVATLTRDYPIVVSGNYSGCLYSVYKARDG